MDPLVLGHKINIEMITKYVQQEIDKRLTRDYARNYLT